MNRSITILLSLGIVVVFCGLKSEKDLAVDKIPDGLRKNANVVLRYSDIILEVHSQKKATYSEEYAITILNERGLRDSYFVKYYDNADKIQRIKGTIYDKYGNKVRKLSGSDIMDISAVSGGTLYDDSRMKVCDPDYSEYPFTVEYEYEIEYNGLLVFPAWMPQNRYEMGIDEARLQLIMTRDDMLRFNSRRSGDPVVKEEDGIIQYSWLVKNLQALEQEPLSVSLAEQVPSVHTAPTRFEYEKTEGSMDSWEGFSSWISSLNMGRDALPQETVLEIQKLVEGKENTREKVKTVYEYMQGKTRYVSVQLGIGGFQPYEAAMVDQKGYGDCKGLTNYAYALLKAVEIPAIYTLVRAGKNAPSMQRDFPSNQFNHVILCIPDGPDTIWLECTSQTQPFDFLGSFTCDRDVLLVAGNDGKIVQTPTYPMEQNTQFRNAEVILEANGKGKTRITTSYAGLQYENIQAAVRLKKGDQIKRLYNTIDIADFDVLDVEYKTEHQELPYAIESLDLELHNYATTSSKRMFLPLNMMNKKSYVPGKSQERHSDLMLTYAYTDSDTIRYVLPSTHTIEVVPETYSYESKFGVYKSEVVVVENIVTYIRNVCMKKGRFPADEYDEFVKFQKYMVKADKINLVLLRK